MRIRINWPAFVYGDNQYFLAHTTGPDSALIKMSNNNAFHFVRAETVWDEGDSLILSPMKIHLIHFPNVFLQRRINRSLVVEYYIFCILWQQRSLAPTEDVKEWKNPIWTICFMFIFILTLFCIEWSVSICVEKTYLLISLDVFICWFISACFEFGYNINFGAGDLVF